MHSTQYRLYPGDTTDQSQVASAMCTDGVRPAPGGAKPLADSACAAQSIDKDSLCGQARH